MNINLNNFGLLLANATEVPGVRMNIFNAVIAEVKQSDIFMHLTLRLFVSNIVNKNNVKVTEDFIDSIISNPEEYNGLPLYADVKALEANGFLSHLYDSQTGKFGTTQIGSFYAFEKQMYNGNPALVGYAKIPKRNTVIRSSITDLFTKGLTVSFEIVTQNTYEEGGITVISGGSGSYLEGVAIVSDPAYESATALQLVAERMNEDMQKESVDTVAQETTTVAEEILIPEEEVVAEESVALPIDEPSTSDVAEEIPAEIVSESSNIEDKISQLAVLVASLNERFNVIEAFLSNPEPRIQEAEKEEEAMEVAETSLEDNPNLDGNRIISEMTIEDKYALLLGPVPEKQIDYSLLK